MSVPHFLAISKMCSRVLTELIMEDEEQREERSIYYDLGDAYNEVKGASGAKETAITGAALAGKALFNTSIWAGKLGIEVIKNLPEAMEKQRERMEAEKAKK